MKAANFQLFFIAMDRRITLSGTVQLAVFICVVDLEFNRTVYYLS